MQTPKYNYRRDLPHIQKDERPIFITFNTYGRWVLPECVRGIVLDCCLARHKILYDLHAAVIMPEHVHLILTPLRNAEGWPVPLHEIVRRIKGPAGLRVNRTLNRHGPVWQDERFDHVLRSAEKLYDRIDYIIANPLRRGLVQAVGEYPWIFYPSGIVD